MSGCGQGSSPPKILGLRARFALALGREERVCIVGLGFEAVLCLGVAVDGVFAAVLERVTGLAGGEITIGEAIGEPAGDVGVGDGIFLLALFAFLLRNFSSSSEEVTSESFALKSILMADSRLLRELPPNDGARLRPAYSDDPVSVSDRLTRRMGIMRG